MNIETLLFILRLSRPNDLFSILRIEDGYHYKFIIESATGSYFGRSCSEKELIRYLISEIDRDYIHLLDKKLVKLCL